MKADKNMMSANSQTNGNLAIEDLVESRGEDSILNPEEGGLAVV